MNRMIFRSFRKRNSSQKNTNTVYSEYSYSGIVPKERALNLPQRFIATISAKVHRHVFSAVSHNIRIAGARGHVRSFAMNMTLFGDHIFPYGDFKKKIQSPVGACLKKLISDPVKASHLSVVNSMKHVK